MSVQGFYQDGDDVYIYQETSGASAQIESCSIGIDDTGNVFNIFSQIGAGSNPTAGYQIQIDMGANGNVSINPNGTGATELISGNLKIQDTTASTEGVIEFDDQPYFHKFGSGGNNLFVGDSAGNFTLSTGQSNIGIGSNALTAIDTSQWNVAVGVGALQSLTGGRDNTAIGQMTGSSLLTGEDNIFIGEAAGNTLTGAESWNIYIKNVGVLGESNTIRLGRSDQHTTCYISGIFNTTPGGGSDEMVIVDANGQLGSQAIPTGMPSWTVTTDASVAAAVNNGYIANRAGLVTITIPTTAAVGDTVRVANHTTTAVGWRIAQNAGETIYFGNTSTTTGVGGYLEATATGDAVELVCVVANTDWRVLSSIGNVTVV